jgi:porphobilinogen synthase
VKPLRSVPQPAPAGPDFASGAPLPRARPRRLRRTPALRALVCEHAVAVSDLIEPLFVVPGRGVRQEVPSMPGVFVQSVDRLVEDVREGHDVGLRAVLLFGVPEHKDEQASELADPRGVVQQAIGALKRELPDVLVIADLCACEYTSHGHCGLLDERGVIDNDRTLALLARGALSYAACGVDMVAPSDMMDGRVAYLRHALDEAGHLETGVLSYAVKYASALYGPFRDAAQSTPAFGDRRTHQMDPPNAREAIKEAQLDAAEGADMIIVKPALGYLDIVWRVREAVNLPVAAYSVSGEYAMLKAAARNGWIDEDRAVDELLVGCKRAGADAIVTYFARSFARRHNGRPHTGRRSR